MRRVWCRQSVEKLAECGTLANIAANRLVDAEMHADARGDVEDLGDLFLGGGADPEQSVAAEVVAKVPGVASMQGVVCSTPEVDGESEQMLERLSRSESEVDRAGRTVWHV